MDSDPIDQDDIMKGKLPVNFAPCHIDKKRKKIVLDLGNSLPTEKPGKGLKDVGELQLALLSSMLHPTKFGKIDYQQDNWYEKTAGIQEFDFSDQQLQDIEKTPLALLKVGAGNQPHDITPLLCENDQGAYIRADQFVFRLDPYQPDEEKYCLYPQQAKVKILATRFGKPSAGEIVNLTVNVSDANALKFSSMAVTDSDGWATFILHAFDPGTPRDYIDGQVYKLSYSWAPMKEDKGYHADPSNFISVRVSSVYIPKHKPTSPKSWKDDIYPVLAQYAKLYPIMADLKLSDENKVKQRAQMINDAMMLDILDPGYMPVVRDLSNSKLEMIIKWLDERD